MIKFNRFQVIFRISFMLKFIVYKLFARHRKGHGIHSPFLYNFIKSVLNSKCNKDEFIDVNLLRKKLSKDASVIQVTDLGGGSSFGLKQERRIKDIIKHSAIKKKYGELLYRMLLSNKFKSVIELGTSLGIGSIYLAKAIPESRVVTIEGCPELASKASRNFEDTGILNVSQKTGNFDDVLPKVLENMKSVDFVFFDGNHTKEATIRYFELCLKYKHNESIFYFDDIRWSREMLEAWEQIRLHKDVSLTIDLFFQGIVFFKKELSKQDFQIKF